VSMKNMDRWLGDGGMKVIGATGASIDGYGITEGTKDGGWATGAWVPTEMACNPHGIVQAGVHAVIHDALMNFAINTACNGKDRTKATLEMKTELIRAAKLGDTISLRGDVVRMTKQIAFAEGRILDADGNLLSRSTGTFLMHRDTPPEPPA
jgi:uncharacterized protein (TIGR00369 family)